MITGQLKRIIELQSLQPDSVNHKSNICTVVSGKGGTGKTLFSILVSNFLAKKKRKILLVDLDINLANIHFLLNQTPNKSLNNYFNKHQDLQNIITAYSDNLHIIYGLNSYSLNDIPFKSSIDNLLKDIQLLSNNYDFIILDLGAGLSELTIKALQIAAIKVIISIPEATSVMDAYAVIKMFENYYKPSEFKIVMNRCLKKSDGLESFNKLSKAVTSFLKSSVNLLTIINESKELLHSVAEQTLISLEDSEDNSISEFMMVAEEIDKYIHLTNINQPSKASLFSTAKNNSKNSFIL